MATPLQNGVMKSRGGKVAAVTGASALAVSLAAAIAAKDLFREAWYIHKLETGDAAAKVLAAKALGEMGSVRSTSTLVRTIREQEIIDFATLPDLEPPTREALRALSRLGARACPVLIRELSHRDPKMRRSAAYGLWVIGSPAVQALPILESMSKNDPDEEVRWFAEYAAASIRLEPKPAEPSESVSPTP